MLLDITKPIHPDMAIYPGNPSVDIERIQEASDGASALSRICFGSHTGTHIDAPSHVDVNGHDVEAYTLDAMNGACEVVDATSCDSVVTDSDIPEPRVSRVLFKTRNSEGDVNEFDKEFVALDESAAHSLVRSGVRLVGIDAPSIKKKGVRDAVHSILLDAGIIILEGVWLHDVRVGRYELLCLPLSVHGVDGVPVRAALRDDVHV